MENTKSSIADAFEEINLLKIDIAAFLLWDIEFVCNNVIHLFKFTEQIYFIWMKGYFPWKCNKLDSAEEILMQSCKEKHVPIATEISQGI